RDQVVRRDRPRALEPERGELIQHLALERQRADDDVEAAHAVGHDDRAPVARDVAVAYLALLAAAQAREVGLRERASALVAQQSGSVPMKGLPRRPMLQSRDARCTPARARGGRLPLSIAVCREGVRAPRRTSALG